MLLLSSLSLTWLSGSARASRVSPQGRLYVRSCDSPLARPGKSKFSGPDALTTLTRNGPASRWPLLRTVNVLEVMVEKTRSGAAPVAGGGGGGAGCGGGGDDAGGGGGTTPRVESR